MKFAISIGLLVLAVSGCGRQPQPSDTPGVDVTNVTDVAVATTPSSSTAGSTAGSQTPDSEGDTARGSTTESSSEGSTQDVPVSLNLSLPEKELGKDPDYLFADKDNTPNYFKSKSRSDDARVKLKGKVYMIEEPSAEKRIENLDGGEIGIVVPLR